MKNFILSTTVVAILAGMVCLPDAAYSQNKSTKSTSHKVGLVDMAYIFKNYKKFKAELEDLGAEMKSKDTEGKKKVKVLQSLGEQMKVLKQSSPEFAKLEKEYASAASDLAAFKKVAERDFMRKQSKIYKKIYIEVKDVIDRAATGHGFTLVLRFNRQDLDEADDPKQILNGMNRQVVYHRGGDDLTEPVLDYLNKKYEKESGTTTRSANRKTRSTKK